MEFFKRARISATKLAKKGTGHAWYIASLGGRAGFVVATTTMVVLLPILMELGREGEIIALDKQMIKDLKLQGYSDPQLLQMGYPDYLISNPPVANAL